ncbi:MAG TPA: MTH938/NDUFAF3 family protein [bacterium]|nr:MTH938/NDUFAF3 family protein [bacterium]
MKIDSYSFGKIVIDGKDYTSDLIACNGEVDAAWWRKAGHELGVDDLNDILVFQPKTVIVGTGHDGFMKVLPEAEDFCRRKGIQLLVKKTQIACDVYNSIADQSQVVFAAHLTC